MKKSVPLILVICFSLFFVVLQEVRAVSYLSNEADSNMPTECLIVGVFGEREDVGESMSCTDGYPSTCSTTKNYLFPLEILETKTSACEKLIGTIQKIDNNGRDSIGQYFNELEPNQKVEARLGYGQYITFEGYSYLYRLTELKTENADGELIILPVVNEPTIKLDEPEVIISEEASIEKAVNNTSAPEQKHSSNRNKVIYIFLIIIFLPFYLWILITKFKKKSIKKVTKKSTK